jgi:uncharacterized heparinase superfamily protein
VFRKAVYFWDNIRRQSLSQLYWRVRNRIVLQKLVDPWLVRRHITQAPKKAVPGVGVSPDQFFEAARAHAAQQPFFGQDDARIIAAARRDAGAEVRCWIALADEVLAGRYPIVGEESFDLGFPPERWDRNPSRDFEWQVALHRLRLFGVALAKARAYTGEARYSDGFQTVVNDWIDRHPMGTPLATFPMQTTVRLHGCFWAYRILMAADALDREFVLRFVSSMTVQTDFLCNRLERDLNENHLLYNYFTVFLASIALPVPARASRWRAIGQRGMLTELERQFHSDGLHAEQSTGYHVSMTVLCVEWLWLCRSHGIEVPRWAWEAIERAIDACLLFWKPGPALWLMSDAFYSFMSWNLVDDVRTSLLVGASLFDRDDLLDEVDRPSEWSCWMLGERVGELLARNATQQPDTASRQRSAGGYHVVRTGSGADLESFAFDGGPFAMPHVAGHGHSDCLSVVWSVGRQEILTDPGIWVYHPSEASAAFKRTACHNTVMIDGKDHAALWTFHRWCFLPTIQTHAFERRGEGFFLDGEHDGYERLATPLTHRRRIWYLPGAALLIEDGFRGAGEHAVQSSFQFGVGLDVDSDGKEGVRFCGGNVSGRMSVIQGDRPLAPELEQAIVCPDYNVRRGAWRCAFRTVWSPGCPMIETLFVLGGTEGMDAGAVRARVGDRTTVPTTESRGATTAG